MIPRILLAAFLASSASMPAAAQESPAPPGKPGPGFIDVGRLALIPQLSFLFFSGDFESDPKFGGGFSLHAPMPWFSREVVGLDHDDFGLLLDLTVSGIDRDIDLLEDPSGNVWFVTTGMDYAFWGNETFGAEAQIGLQYGDFGGVTDLDNGFALMAGLRGRARIARGIHAIVDSQIGFGNSGDDIYFLKFGVQIDF